jgi:O-antigen/teichoic acid export membrane protein
MTIGIARRLPRLGDLSSGRSVALVRRVGWGVADQGISSLSNFVLGILVARTLLPEQFGAFSLAFITFGFVISAVRGPSTDPLMVRFSGVTGPTWARAVSAATATALSGGLLAGIVCVVAGLALSGAVGPGFVALGVGLPGIMLQDSYRFAFFSCGRGDRAFVNDLLWGVLQIGGLVVLGVTGHVTVVSCLLVFGGSGTLAAVVASLQIGIAPRPWLVRSWLVDHSSLGMRYLVENVSIGAARQIRFYAVGVLAGLAAAGEIRAAEILMGPFMIVLAGVSQVSVPEARSALAAEPPHLMRFSVLLASVQVAGALVWTVTALVVLPMGLGEFLLKDLWPQAHVLLVPISLMLMLGCFENSAAAGVRALGASRRSLRAQLLNASLYVIAGSVGAALGGAVGSAWGVVMSTVVATSFWWYQLRAGLADHQRERVAVPHPSAPVTLAPGRGTGD